MTKYEKKDHTFVVCAYKESPWLEECIRSLLSQTVRSEIRIATSTPNGHIQALGEKYGLPVFINQGEAGIAGDWNFAYNCAETPLVTLAHQDDRYEKHYTEDVLAALNDCSHPLIAFTDYYELREGKRIYENRLLRIKGLMLRPLRTRTGQKSRFIRRRILSLGNPICCPAVTYVREHLEGFSFRNNMASNIDWQAWEELSRRKGEFVYLPRKLTAHRIHRDSTTSEVLAKNRRQREDLEILKKFWPPLLAALIEHFYKKSEDSNDTDRG